MPTSGHRKPWNQVVSPGCRINFLTRLQWRGSRRLQVRSVRSHRPAVSLYGHGMAAFRILLSVVLLLWISASSYAEQSLRVGLYQGGGMPLGGFAEDVLKQVAYENGWQLTFKEERGPEVLSMLEGKAVDLVLNVPHTDPYRDRYLFNKQPVFNDWAELYKADGSSFDSPVDLDRKRIGVAGDLQLRAAQDLLRAFSLDAELISYASASDAARSVTKREIDAAVLDRAFSLNGAEAFDIEKLPYAFAPYEIRVVAADTSLSLALAAVDDYLAIGRQDGSSSYFAIFEKWFPADRSYHPPGYSLWLAALVAASLFSFLFGRLLRFRTGLS